VDVEGGVLVADFEDELVGLGVDVGAGVVDCAWERDGDGDGVCVCVCVCV